MCEFCKKVLILSKHKRDCITVENDAGDNGEFYVSLYRKKIRLSYFTDKYGIFGVEGSIYIKHCPLCGKKLSELLEEKE